MQYSFGTGTLFGRKVVSSGVATPVKFGAVQGVTVDITHTVKELYGKYTYPLDVARGTAKVTGKCNFGQFNGLAFNDIFFGQTSLATGRRRTITEEAKTVTANAVTVTNNTGFFRDLGVNYANNGSYFDRVAASANASQYVCNESTGVYTFNAADNSAAVLVSYQYTDASNGKLITIQNQLLGNAPSFLMVLNESHNNKEWTLELNACMSNKLALATKTEDFTLPEIDFHSFADASGVVGYLSNDE